MKEYHGTLDDGDFPEIVYKYRDWNANHHSRFIKNREVYMAAPSSFEDKMDCKIPVRYDLLNEKQTMEFAMKLSKIRYPHFNRAKHRQECKDWIKTRPLKNKKSQEEYKKYYFQEHDKRFGVLSLTAEPCLEEMWNKYANNSQGFCIGYNSRIMFEFLGGGGHVEYVDSLPIIFPEPIMSHAEMRYHQFFKKEKKWSFEKEYRTHMFWPDPVSIQDRQIKLPPEAFNKIIIGKNMPDDVKKEIKIAVRDNIGNIPIVEQTSFCK